MENALDVGLASMQSGLTIRAVSSRSRRSRTAPSGKPLVDYWGIHEGASVDAVNPRRIRVCLLDPGLQIGGAEWFTTLLMQFANPHLYEFRVLCYRPETGGLKTYIESFGCRVISATMLFGEGLSYQEWLQNKLWTMLELQCPDIVYFSSNFLYERILAEGSLDNIKRYPVVVRISNFDPTELEGINFSPVSKIICCSEEQFSFMSALYPDKSVLIKTGVDINQFHPVARADQERVRQELDLPQKTTVLFCGRLSDPLKRTWIFQQVVTQILEERDDIAFLVVGYFESHRNSGEVAFKQFVSDHGIVW
jgi:hypothetical protein